MDRDILIESNLDRRQMAVLEDGRLREIYVEHDESGKCQGRIYLGRVVNVLPGMQAAFVDIGLEKNAFLFEGDVPIDKADAADLQDKIKPVGRGLKAGQELMVQVVKDPGGDKGPRISCHITLPGRYLVLLPTVEYVGISHKIEDDAEKGRLRSIAEAARPEGMGLIVRTAAVGASGEELDADIQRLARLWESLCQRACFARAPQLLYRDENLACRAVRDMLNADVRSIVIDDEGLYSDALAAAQAFSPELTDRVQLYQETMPLFDLRQVRSQIEGALSRKVWLKSGGYLIIDPTEALTVIDVNSGKYVGKTNLSETVFKINCEAADEIARQLRLRDVGGIIVIDFIDMDRQEQKDELVARLRQALKSDPSKTHVVGITGLGLVEMTRKRAHQSIRKQLTRPCPVCKGDGAVLNEDTQAHDAFLLLRRTVALQKAEAYLMEAPRSAVDRIQQMGGLAGVEIWLRIAGTVSVTPCTRRDIPKDARKLVKP